MGSRITVIVTARIFLIFFPLVKSICDNPQRKIMPSIIFWGLSLCSMIARVIPNEDTGVRNRTKQSMQTIVVQSKLDFGNIESRMSTLEAGVAEVKSGVAEVNSAVADMKSLLAKLVENANGGNGSLTVGGNNKTNNNIDDKIDTEIKKKLKKDCTNGASCYHAVVEEKKSWDEARRSCQAMGQDLLTITSSEEQKNLMKYLYKTFPKEYSFWIGSKSRSEQSKREWITGEPIATDSTFIWNGDSKSPARQKCLAIHHNGYETKGFCGHYCYEKNPYVCTKKN